MKLLILAVLLSTSWAAPAVQTLSFQDDGSYRFYYETGREGGSHSRSEARGPDGVVIGRFSYADPDGQLREVNYRADGEGFVAEGDVSVKGAPKGKFPPNQDEIPQDQTVYSPQPQETHPPEEQPIQSQADEAVHTLQEATSEQADPPTENLEQSIETSDSQPKSEDVQLEPRTDEEDKDEMQDLTLEESLSDDPPEAFPPGFFSEKFHSLRRLPEPTKEVKPSTENPNEPQNQSEEEVKEEKKDDEVTPQVTEEKAVTEPNVYPPLKFFPEFSPPDWAAAMFHQPVYVFSYQQPDSYGYHYFF